MASHSIPPNSPFGLPSTPRATRPTVLINTNLQRPQTASPDRYHDKESPDVFVDPRTRTRESMIFANATIPLSPISASSDRPVLGDKEAPFDGLAPRKRSGFARLFCCFGREERARRRTERFTEYEKVPDTVHWSEY